MNCASMKMMSSNVTAIRATCTVRAAFEGGDLFLPAEACAISEPLKGLFLATRASAISP
jgi:hypothetical protein